MLCFWSLLWGIIKKGKKISLITIWQLIAIKRHKISVLAFNASEQGWVVFPIAELYQPKLCPNNDDKIWIGSIQSSCIHIDKLQLEEVTSNLKILGT